MCKHIFETIEIVREEVSAPWPDTKYNIYAIRLCKKCPKKEKIFIRSEYNIGEV